jgi:DNA-binding response OmpR family regulator
MTPKILVVDDEPGIVVPLRFLMEQNGYTVATADSGEKALALLDAFIPDLILLDIMLPAMDGFAVCQALRTHPGAHNARIVFLTALGRDVEMEKGLAMGADAYIVKPFANAEVLTTVQRLLAR